MPDDGSRRPCCPGSYVHASLNYTITDQLYPRDKNSRDLSVPRVFLSLKTRNPVSLLAWWRHQKVRHMREKAMYTLYCCTWEAETQKSKFASRSSPLFRVRVPSPQNYAMVKRVSSNLVILVSLEQRQVFSWRWYTQGPNSLHQQAMIAGAQIWRYFSNLPHLEKPLLIRQLKALLFTRSISLYWPTSLYSLHSLCSLYSLYRPISLYWIWGPMRLHSSETICVQIKWLTLQKQKTKKWMKIYFI